MTDPNNFAPRGQRSPSTELVHVPCRLPAHMNRAEVAHLLRAEMDKPRRAEVARLRDNVSSLTLLAGATSPPTGNMLVMSAWAHRRLVNTVKAERHKGRPEALFAALNARRAILESRAIGDWKAVVTEFARTWLGIRRVTQDWMEAVFTALIGTWVDEIDRSSSAGHDEEAITLLGKESKQVHRELQPLWRRKAGQQRVQCLDRPLTGGRSLLDVLGTPATTEQTALPWEPESAAAATVFGWLKADEQAIVRLWAARGENRAEVWKEAAVHIGLDPERGVSVMRKLRRLGKRYDLRRESAAMHGGAQR
ncbi:hypothetical protein OHA91_39535 (plasmid) [Streptomyces erythrochromogenes]|uniref:Uncharacterized protein n=1 Tax=Streptomyces erythrochromogenes TaxID=285574 RepID=A0ABZ1QPX4_9ACTN|nr:hypothetical protein [Streptomyces erythrochromogenes]